jgi:hypothetical protein
MCTAYNLTTCPANHWGDASTSSCVPCDATLGKVSTGVVGATAEAAACKQAAFIIVGTGVEHGDASNGSLVLDEQCVTDGVGNYGSNEQAAITAVGGGVLYSAGLFETYYQAYGYMPYNSYLTVKGAKIYGTTPPDNVVLVAGETFTWTSTTGPVGAGYHKAGFTLCICETLGTYKAYVNSMCTTYNLTTCPIGHWGNATTSSCIPCDATKGKFASGIVGATSEAAACSWSTRLAAREAGPRQHRFQCTPTATVQ